MTRIAAKSIVAKTTARAARMLLLAPLLASCAAIQANQQGPLQPQTVAGPCQVPKFFLLGLRSVPVQMTVSNAGQACSFTLVNPALNAVIDASLLTRLPAHGHAETGLVNGNRQAGVSYTPTPGYIGPDTFSVTLEPGAVGITVNVTVGSP